MTKQLSALIHVFLYWGHLVKIDTALYLISTQRNLAVASENISMPLNPDFYGSKNLRTLPFQEVHIFSDVTTRLIVLGQA